LDTTQLPWGLVDEVKGQVAKAAGRLDNCIQELTGSAFVEMGQQSGKSSASSPWALYGDVLRRVQYYSSSRLTGCLSLAGRWPLGHCLADHLLHQSSG